MLAAELGNSELIGATPVAKNEELKASCDEVRGSEKGETILGDGESSWKSMDTRRSNQSHS